MDTHTTDDLMDNGSVTDPSIISDTTSLTSSILNYQYENGRRYHAFKAGKYLIPNDEQEQDRLDIQHHLHCIVLDGELYAAPLKNPQAILDAGTGTGLWAIEMADLFPESRVIGTDLSPTQPRYIPANLTFEVDDIESDWIFPCKFDYIHLKMMGGSIADWPALLEKCLHSLSPGGWVEIIDGEVWASTDDNSLPEISAYHEWQTNLNLAARTFGRDMNIIPKMEGMLKDAGFVDVEDKMVQIPLNHWDIPQTKKQKELATYMNVVMFESLEAYSFALFTRVLGWNRARLDKLLDNVRVDLRNPKYHMYTNMHHVYGRKPEM